MKLLRTAALVASVVLLSACAHDYVRPAQDTLRLGKATQDDVIKLVGKPNATNDNIQLNGEKVKSITYFFMKGAAFYGMIMPQRTLVYSFMNDVMVGEEFNSSFDEEKTEFQSEKVGTLVKGKSTKADVIALLGKPSGEVMYPLVKDKKGRGLVYAYTVSRLAPFVAPTTRYRAFITLDENNVVTSVSMIEDGEEKVKS